MTIIDYALGYARRGWHVFAISPNGKEPLKGSRGWKDGTTDEEAIRFMFDMVPGANLAICTGKINDIVVVDVDPRNGGDKTIDNYNFEGTMAHIVLTPQGGYHLYYKYNDFVYTTSLKDSGIDIKSDGGYVLAPPSSINGVEYKWR